MPSAQIKPNSAKQAKRTGTSTIQKRKQQLIRGEIWDAAMDLFAEKGFDETTIDDIAQAAEVSRRSFFRYFSSKSDLMGQSIVSYGEALDEIIRALPPALSRFEAVRGTAVTFVSGAAAYPRTRKIMAVAAKYPEARAAQLSRMAEVEDRVAQAFADRFGERRYNELAPRLLAGLTLTVIDTTLRLWFELEQRDIAVTAEHVLSKLEEVTARKGKTHQSNEPATRAPRRAPANKKNGRTSQSR
jgi:AcrR family transcriptional regulator